jgi:recombination protein RecR
MDNNQYSSRLLEKVVNEFAKLPGIGRKTALRLVLHLLKQAPEEIELFTESIRKMQAEIHHCKVCHNISDQEVCTICSNTNRDRNILCVVENIRDVMAVEATRQFNGLYHVLGGIISPMDGIGPSDLTIGSLVERCKSGGVDEVILGLSATMEGDTTNFYIYRKLADLEINITTLARGVAIGDDLEYTDEITLGRSIKNRTPFDASLKN